MPPTETINNEQLTAARHLYQLFLDLSANLSTKKLDHVITDKLNHIINEVNHYHQLHPQDLSLQWFSPDSLQKINTRDDVEPRLSELHQLIKRLSPSPEEDEDKPTDTTDTATVPIIAPAEADRRNELNSTANLQKVLKNYREQAKIIALQNQTIKLTPEQIVDRSKNIKQQLTNLVVDPATSNVSSLDRQEIESIIDESLLHPSPTLFDLTHNLYQRKIIQRAVGNDKTTFQNKVINTLSQEPNVELILAKEELGQNSYFTSTLKEVIPLDENGIPQTQQILNEALASSVPNSNDRQIVINRILDNTLNHIFTQTPLVQEDVNKLLPPSISNSLAEDVWALQGLVVIQADTLPITRRIQRFSHEHSLTPTSFQESNFPSHQLYGQFFSISRQPPANFTSPNVDAPPSPSPTWINSFVEFIAIPQYYFYGPTPNEVVFNSQTSQQPPLDPLKPLSHLYQHGSDIFGKFQKAKNVAKTATDLSKVAGFIPKITSLLGGSTAAAATGISLSAIIGYATVIVLIVVAVVVTYVVFFGGRQDRSTQIIAYGTGGGGQFSNITCPAPCLPINMKGLCWPATGYVSQDPENPGHKTSAGGTAFDISNVVGTPIATPFDGYVDLAQWHDGYGNAVRIIVTATRDDDNPVTFTLIFGHFSSIYVHQGQSVKQGDLLGAMGSTGNSTGSHLHYEAIGINVRQLVPNPNAEGALKTGYPINESNRCSQ